jgi:predicted nucleic acid-binding protein
VRSTLVVDTGVAYAAVDPSEPDHETCAALLRTAGTTITLPAPVVTETCLLSLSRWNPAAATAVLDSVADGTVIVVDLDAELYRRVRQLVERYSDLPLDIVDASVVAVAERLQETTIATLDRRHFSVVQPLHCEAFSLLP